MNKVYDYLRNESLPTKFCPGCGHGTILGSVIRAIDEMKLDIKKMVFVSGIGCGGWISSPNIDADTVHTTHGRAISVATGIKLTRPDLRVVVISGDGDLTTIGGNHLIHAARRNITMTVICANNHIYGMTGGQTSGTTPMGIKTITDPRGNIYPGLNLAPLVKAAGANYVARFTTYHVRELIRSIKKAFDTEGFSFIEAIYQCPTHYGKITNRETVEMLKYFQKNSLNIKKAKELNEKEIKEKLVIGEF